MSGSSIYQSALLEAKDLVRVAEKSQNLALITPQLFKSFREEWSQLKLEHLPTAFSLAKDLNLSPIEADKELLARLSESTTSFFGTCLFDATWTWPDALTFLAHLGRDVVHASLNRDFAKSFWRRICPSCQQKTRTKTQAPTKVEGCSDEKCGTVYPRYYRPNKLGDFQYIEATTKYHASFVVVDIDIPGKAGGGIDSIHPKSLELLTRMTRDGFAPNWLGINPISGKAQVIWYIDPAYTDGGTSKSMNFWKALKADLNELIGGDRKFAHRIMRNPLYTGSDVTAYHWNCYHHGIYQMRQLSMEVAHLGGHVTTGITQKPSELRPKKTGRDIILQAKANRESALRLKALDLDDLDFSAELEKNDPNVVEGVRIIYSETKTPMRDVTAFRHALKTAHRLRNAGKRLSDEAIIDAYHHAYTVAQRYDNLGRADERPAMRDLKTLARRVRGYVTHASRRKQNVGVGVNHVSPQERSALKRFGARGGKVSAERKWNDKESPEAQKALAPLKKANKKRVVEGQARRARILTYVLEQSAETGTAPTRREIASALSMSPETVKKYIRELKKLGMIPL